MSESDLFFFMVIGVLSWFAASIAAGHTAGDLNRSRFGWFAAAMLISPIVALLALIAKGPKKDY